jgi:glycosyltransferase involved in cell wall biosynthesis
LKAHEECDILLKMSDLRFSILIPTYNGGALLGETLRSILSQSFQNYDIIISDDASRDDTEELIHSFKDRRIKFFCNFKNLGYSRNLEVGRKRVTGDILYLMGQDDILGKGALMDTYNAFKLSEDIGAVTRPYFWFDKEIDTPVIAKDQLNAEKDEVVTIAGNPNRIIKMFSTLDQLSGLAYRRKYMDLSFHGDVFPCHVYPFASIFKKYPVVFLRDYNIAVRIASSQTRSASSIYTKSPVQSWVEMFDNVFYEDEFKSLKTYLIKNFVAQNYVGLVQIKNYAKHKYLWREIFLLLRYRWQNIFNPKFWFFSLGCMVMPPALLIPLVDWYKREVNARTLCDIKFEYEL